jgi:hypothetical protein
MKKLVANVAIVLKGYSAAAAVLFAISSAYAPLALAQEAGRIAGTVLDPAAR